MPTTPLVEPLFFQRLLQEKVWGGFALAERLGINLPFAGPLGETWELSDCPGQETIIAGGPFGGTSLRELMETHSAEILGDSRPTHDGRFPLLVKFLDATDDLSVQVHPPDGLAPGAGVGKTEAWFVLNDGGSVISGLEAGTQAKSFSEHAHTAEVEGDLHEIGVRRGDCVFVPAGQTHAIRSGTMLCEIQQTSDVTYRLYDWGRLGLDGKPRATHLKEALRVVDYSLPPGEAVRGECAENLLVVCPYFRMRSFRLNADQILGIESHTHARVMAVVGGSGQMAGRELKFGDTFLLPASLEMVSIQASGDGLEIVEAEAL
ncbi:MAG: class I mannose-6-phosphate isomerase [Planctomycetes bacterium]|jgi:mannose-6-phosphate isomerase|nr:class I mannose-6-phosphate isomerase [Planctomycetota bacterium]MBT4028708.1 class I mannose-6-phosphate isomerase [Planctomycetota bacterium]MBT4560078.1 class I mannose-6-phosphate isomerase [Planctomycetota bacterium]MBT5100710.1 class I mannose-6-phosphate isomerase [Planctomycetota bacterium]MBT5120466.1 class I mannose-6-phosphate isomerase [Planctomycetota bacterium]